MMRMQDLKILAVEDNKIQSFVIDRLLGETGAVIRHAANGKDAVELAASEHFDVILMNIKMPVMDGFEATREIRKFNDAVIIIAHTNYSGIRDKCLNSGFNDYIRKPFGKSELIDIIKKHFAD